jgi:hypothetical protein
MGWNEPATWLAGTAVIQATSIMCSVGCVTQSLLEITILVTSKCAVAKKGAAKSESGQAVGKTAKDKAGSAVAETVQSVTSMVKGAATALRKKAVGKTPVPTPEQRYRMVQDAAYFIAERHGFERGAMDYWLAAEAEIEALLAGNGKK